VTQKVQTRDPNSLRARYLGKQLEIETPFQSRPTTNRKWPMGYRMVTCPMSSHETRKVKLVTPIRLELNMSKTAGNAIASH